jgi:mercuric ion transport protein
MLSETNETRAERLTLAGAVVAAIAASSCCIGPLLLAALGIGGAGAFAAIAAYRPSILAVTAALLAGGFYLSYRKPKVAEGDACGCESPKPKANRAARFGLWIATALVVVFAAAPPLLAAVSHAAPVPVQARHPVQQAVLSVQGLDCEACAAPIRSALTKVGGFQDLRLDLKAQTVAVTYEPAPGRLQAYVAAIGSLGYEVSAPGSGKAAAP